MLCVFIVGDLLLFQFNILEVHGGMLEYGALRSRFNSNLVHEFRLVVIAALVLLVVQLVRYPRRETAIRKGSPLIACVMGIMFCWIRWLIYAWDFCSKRPMSRGLHVGIAIVLAAWYGWRWPGFVSGRLNCTGASWGIFHSSTLAIEITPRFPYVCHASCGCNTTQPMCGR